MTFFKIHPYLSTLIVSSILVSGCGTKQDENVVAETFDTRPQVTITLHSELELDFPLDPDPQLPAEETGDLEKAPSDKIDRMYSEIKKKMGRDGKTGKQLKDVKYQSIKRFEVIDPERYAITIKKSPDKPSDPVRETVKIQDKPLIFAGRGYNISTFEKEIKPAIDVDYSTHLVAIPPEPPKEEIYDRLDPNAGYSRDTKFLVYNSTRSAFGKLPPPPVEDEPVSPHSTEPVIPLERNQDSVLIFPKGKESMLVLRKAEKQYDLLAGNEALNKKQFQASSITVPGTSNKIPNTLQ